MTTTRQIQDSDWDLWDLQIRAGETRGVAQLLKELKDDNFRQTCLPAELLKLAELSRRCGLFEIGLFFIEPLTRQNGEARGDASSKASLIRASLLFDLGLIAEGRSWLQRVQPHDEPRRLLIESWQLFAEWNYESALPLLQRYVEMLDPESYDWAIAKVNELSARSFDSSIFEQGHQLIQTLEKRKAYTLVGNCHEIIGSQHLERGDLSKAEVHLQRAQVLHREAQKKDSLYIEKWLLILKIKKGLIDGRAEILELKRRTPLEWETHRSLDFEWARHRQDVPALAHLWFGTPFPSFRKKIEAVSPRLPLEFQYRLPRMGPSPDVSTAPMTTLHFPQDKLQGLLSALTEDFYKPKKIYELFTSLYPDEHYIEESSVRKVHQLLFRFRQSLEEQGFPVQLSQSRGFFQLRSWAPAQILRTQGDRPQTKKNSAEDLILEAVHSQAQTITALATQLGKSKRMTQLHLKDLMAAGLIASVGKGLYRRR